MHTKTTYYTQKGLQELKSKHTLLQQERPQLVKKMNEARAKGDLKENAAYHTAKEALVMLDTRIETIKSHIAHAQVIDQSNIDTSKASILTTVKLKNQHTGNNVTYQLVSGQEANIRQGKLSIDSPVGQGLLGKKKGETVTIHTPAGNVTLQIIDISITQ